MSRVRLCGAVLMFGVLLGAPHPATAHAIASSSSTVEVAPAAVHWTIEMEAAAAALALPGDANGDGRTEAPELAAMPQKLRRYVDDRLSAVADGRSCSGGLESATTAAGRVRLSWRARCPPGTRKVRLRFALFFDDVDPRHVGFARIRVQGRERAELFRANAREVEVELRQPPSTLAALGRYLWLGIEHIALGFDHLLFVAGLCLGARRPRDLLVVVTSFTLAHSLTLALAALRLVAIAPSLVEPLIAASIVYVGIENTTARRIFPRGLLALLFGLVHGLGFAGALREAGFGRGPVVAPLVGFNLGVEAGQLATVSVLVPLIVALERWSVARRHVRPWGSALVAAVGAYWLIERVVG